jgi:hypothetical protein
MILALTVLAILIFFYWKLIFEVQTLTKLAIRSLEASEKIHDIMKEALNDLKEMEEMTEDLK